jgi:hypothetical protein
LRCSLDCSQRSERIVVYSWKILTNTFVSGECSSVIIQHTLLSLLIISARSLAGQAPEDIGPEVLRKSCLKKPQLVNFPRPRKMSQTFSPARSLSLWFTHILFLFMGCGIMSHLFGLGLRPAAAGWGNCILKLHITTSN